MHSENDELLHYFGQTSSEKMNVRDANVIATNTETVELKERIQLKSIVAE